MPAALTAMFTKGMVEVVASTKACVFSGGTDGGVIKLVADALKESPVRTPLVGVVSYFALLGWEKLENGLQTAESNSKRGDVIAYNGGSASDTGAPLNPHHTHFICVDSSWTQGEPAPWGAEIALRAEIERAYAQKKGVPQVIV